MNSSGVRKVPTSLGRRRALRCALEALESRTLFSTSLIATPAVANATLVSQPTGYKPSQVLHAYGFDAAAASIGAVGGDGAGQTIAIVEAYHSPTLASDLLTFDKQFGLTAPPSLQEINQNGGNTPPASDIVWSQETALDVEWAHVVAPMANIVVVEANSADIRDLLTAVDTARHLSAVSIVSMSWGINEFPTETAYDNIFTTPKGHQNVTFVASSGDTADSTQVQWPAVSPNVVSVGGTTLTVSKTSSGNASETSYAGAVSGISQYESKPGYQSSVNSSANRSTPDVVYDANPSPGFAVYNSDSAGWQTLGGTSSGAPQWAALLAIANQNRQNAGEGTLNGATQTLPALYNYYANHQQATINTNTSTTALIAGALLSNSGKPQTTGLITALVDNAAPVSTTNNSATQPTKPLNQLPKRKGHPLIQSIVPMLAITRIPVAFNDSQRSAPLTIADGGLVIPAGYAHASTSPAERPSSLHFAATALLAMALPDFRKAADVAQSQADSIAKLMASIYGEIPSLGTASVVPVGIGAMLEVKNHGSWFIAHINVAATFSDAIASFVDDSALLPPPASAHSPAEHSHARAWTVTVAAVAIDGLILYYLAPRPRRSFNSNGGIHWFTAGA